MKTTIMAGMLLLTLLFSGCGPELPTDSQPETIPGESAGASQGGGDTRDPNTQFTTESTVADVIAHPAFAGFGQFLLPLEWGYDEDMPLSQVASLLPYHSHVDPQRAVELINRMAEMAAGGKTIFYDIYTQTEKDETPAKDNTGLFYFRGEPGAPFAIVCPGGGFSYVGSIHEGFPIAQALAEQGYNAFVIQYRTGGADVACEDLAAAISYIFANAEALEVETEGYSLWGGSAGARMAAYLGSYGPAAFGGDDLPRPAAVVMEYTGHSDYTGDDPPTYAIVGEQDGIADPNTMERRINALKAAGIDTEFHRIPGVGHGFGLGVGTPAEGWLEEAAAFWEAQLNHHT